MIFFKYTRLNISYETKKKAIRKMMTTLLTHNAVVSILMENFQKNLNNKEKLVTPSEIVIHRGQEVSFFLIVSSNTPPNNPFIF